MKNKSALVIFGEELPRGWQQSRRQYEVVVAQKKFQQEVETAGLEWVDLGTLIGPGSIYEASAFLEELSHLKLPDGSHLTKSCIYKGYELWWINYSTLFHNFCLPYTQHKKLLAYLKDFQTVSFYRPPFRSLFACYLQAHECEVTILRAPGFKSPSFLPFGVLVQIGITLLSIPVLAIQRRRLMVYTGDKFEKDKDYDFRMRFIYEELRQRKIPFVEFIRGLESWKTVLAHAWKRGRPVIYSDAVTFIGHFISILSGGQHRAWREFGTQIFTSEKDPETRFKLSVATQYLLTVYDDIWAIRIMKWILHAIGVRAAIIPVASERSSHAVFGCKLNAIPTVGILHGVASPHYNVYDFLPGYDGEKMLSVDRYGLWSEWWKEYYLKNSQAYTPEQLYISGPMRPMLRMPVSSPVPRPISGSVKVLFVSEQVAVPAEALPYLRALLDMKEVSMYVTFRPYRDGFEEWLKKNHPDILERVGEDHIIRSGIHNAIVNCDVVVGSYSTAVLEALLQLKTPIFYDTKKWGDYFSLDNYDPRYTFFAKKPEELIDLIMKSKEIPVDTLKKLQKRFFGDPYKNGSKWVVEQVEQVLRDAS